MKKIRYPLIGAGVALVLVAALALLVTRSQPAPPAAETTPDAPGSLTFEQHTGAVFNAAVSPDGSRILSGSGRLSPTDPLVEASLRYWDASTGEQLWAMDDFTDSVYGIAFLPDGQQAVVSTADATMRLLDLETQAVIRRFTAHRNAILSVDISADGTRVVSGGGDVIASVIGFNAQGADNTVRVWDIATGEQVQTLTGHTAAVLGVKFHPTDPTLVYSASGDKTVRVWNIETGEEVQRFEAGVWVSGAAMSPDGRYLVAATGFPGPSLMGATESTLILWDVATGEEIRRFEGHTAPVLTVSFSDDGTRLISGGQDKTVRLWDVSTGDELQRIDSYEQYVLFTRFLPGDERALSASQDSAIRIWSVTVPDR